MPVARKPFQDLVDRHAGELLAFLRVRVGVDEAEDCLQDTLVAALRAYPDLGPGTDARALLFAIARNRAVDIHRARARRPLPFEQPPEPPAPEAPERDPELWSAVARLPQKQRAAVTLRFGADLSHREIGALTGSSEEATRRSLLEGLRKLRKELA